MMEVSSLEQTKARVLTINGGSSSIKFALFEASRVTVRVMHTDEEWMIAKMVCRVLGLGALKES